MPSGGALHPETEGRLPLPFIIFIIRNEESGSMRLLAESLVAAFISLFILNFLGISLETLTSVTSFFVVLLVIILIEEKTGISNKVLIKTMRLGQPILTTAIAFAVLILLSLFFSTVLSKVGTIVNPLVASLGGLLGIIGLSVVLAISYRIFYHFMYKGIEVGEVGAQFAKSILKKF